ncbi:DNA-binding transcriptional regulator Cro [compost metagenome]
MRTEEAVNFFGDKITLARAIGITPQSVSGWGDDVPSSRVKSVRMAMKERAEQLEAEAKLLRKKAQED